MYVPGILWSLVVLLVPCSHSLPAHRTNHLYTQSGRSEYQRQIQPLSCQSRDGSEKGVCMFAWNCVKSGGKHLGTCIDRFYFGSCCLLNNKEILDNSVDTEINTVDIDTVSSDNTDTVNSEDSVDSLESNLIDTDSISDISSSQASSPVQVSTEQIVSLIPDESSLVDESEVQDISLSTTSTTTSTTTTTTTTETTTTTTMTTTTETTATTTTTTSKPTTTGTTTTTPEPTTTGKTTTTSEPTTTGTTTTTSEPTTTGTTTTTSEPTTTTKLISSTSTTTTESTTTLEESFEVQTIASVEDDSDSPSTSEESQPPSSLFDDLMGDQEKTSTNAPLQSEDVVSVVNIDQTKPDLEMWIPVGIITDVTTEAVIDQDEEDDLSVELGLFEEFLNGPESPIGIVTNVPSHQANIVNEIAIPVTEAPLVSLPSTPLSLPVTTASVSVEATPSEEEKKETTSVQETSTNKDEVETTSEVTTSKSPLSSSESVDETTSSEDSESETTADLLTSTSAVSVTVTSPTSTETSSVATTESSETSSTKSETAAPSTEINVVTSIETTANQTTADENVEATTPDLADFWLQNDFSFENISYKDICGRQPWLNQNFRSKVSKYLPKSPKNIPRQGRVVNGKRTNYAEWPWQISLRQWRTGIKTPKCIYTCKELRDCDWDCTHSWSEDPAAMLSRTSRTLPYDKTTFLHKCGAALLTENWAITAAHCVVNVDPDSLLLRMGEYDLGDESNGTDTEEYTYQDRKVAIVVTHTKFDPLTFEYDLALMRFHEPVEFKPNVLPVCLPETDDKLVGQSAWVTGWGRLYEEGPLPSVLQEVDLPIVNNKECEKMYERAGYREHIPEIFICAGYSAGGKDSCEGDSGGPMTVQREDGRFQLAGVISWGIGCAMENQPGVMTRISHFRDWIQTFLKF